MQYLNNTFIRESSSIYIFGAGSIAKKVKNILINEGKSVSAFIVTSSKPDQYIENIEVTGMESNFDTSLPVIIGIFNREPNAFLSEIILKLRSIGFNKIVTYPEFHSIYHKKIGNIFWLTDRNFFLQNEKQFNRVLDLLHDKASIDNYKMIIKYFRTFDPSVLRRPDFENHYFPADIDVWNGKDAFFDIGSFDGSNIIDAWKHKGILDSAIAFEPDLENFKKLVQNPFFKKITQSLAFYPCGVWSETTYLKFDADGSESTAISDSGQSILPVIKIDEVLKIKAGYIKFDVEGAEIEALLGCRNTITEYKPSLAISIYHRPDHFYAIPDLIASWDLGYKMYIRLHGNNLFDTVLYCIL